MVTIYELKQLGEEVVEMAVLAHSSDKLDELYEKHARTPFPSETDLREAEKAVLSEEAMASYRSEFECIARWLADIDGVDQGGNDWLQSAFERIANEEYGRLEIDENGDFTNSPDFDLLEEHTQLYGIIQKESLGDAFTAFGDQFLLKLPRMQEYQAAIAMSLGKSARLTNLMYNRARKDAATLATEAKNEFARMAGHGTKGGGDTMLGLLGLVVGFVGFAPAAATAAGVVGAFLGVAGLLADNPPAEAPPKSETISGDTAIAVRDSLQVALDENVLTPLSDGEDKIQTALASVNDFLDDPATRSHVVAPDMSFPK